jgi:hypothetical protein
VPNATELAGFSGSGYVLAPAGFGKSHLIAEAVKQSPGRQLVLTHTYAGLSALRTKLRMLGASSRLFRLDTIASWALRLVLSFARTSGWTQRRPEGAEWTALYISCARLLDSVFIGKAIRASYKGVFVDEYQDCSVEQHRLVTQIAKHVPCRVLGDPMQSLFDFGDEPVDWSRDVESSFQELGTLTIPQRWIRAGAPQIGEWIADVRRQLLGFESIDLTNVRAGISPRIICSSEDLVRSQVNVCRFFKSRSSESAVAIHRGAPEYKAKCHMLARSLRGSFTSIEEIEGRALFSRLKKLNSANSSKKKLREVLSFAAECMTAVKQNLSEATLRGEKAKIRANTKFPDVAIAANRFLDDPTSGAMVELLHRIEHSDRTNVVRRDLYNRMLGVLRKHALNPEADLLERAEKYQAEFRYMGRLAGRRLIGTTLLIKGLEFHHAIVLDAASLSSKELYVALTRGSKSLTIVSTSAMLNPY